MTVYCNDEKCDYNELGLCFAERIDIDGMCLTFREKVNEESEENKSYDISDIVDNAQHTSSGLLEET